jgi:hypothetical protein
MMRATLTAAVLSFVGGAVCAQAANEGIRGLELCLQAAHIADAICSDPKNNPVQRLDCFQKARAAQLECLQHVPLGMSAGPEAPENPMDGASPVPGPSRPETTPVPPDKSARTEVLPGSGEAVSPRPSVESVPQEVPTGIVPSSEPIASPKPPPETVPIETPTATVSPEKPPIVPPDLPAGAIDTPLKAQDTNWVVSETTSPVDYSALITATIRSASSAEDAPNILAIRCRQLHTELLVRTEGTWSVARASDVQVDYQINDKSFVRSKWAVSGDGKIVTYKDDAVGLLRSIPEGALLKINVLDKPANHDATFQLSGLDAIRKKIAVACKWGPALDAMSSGKR